MLKINYSCFSNNVCYGSIGMLGTKIIWFSFYDDGSKLIKFINDITSPTSKNDFYRSKSVIIKQNTTALKEHIDLINRYFAGENVDFSIIELCYIIGTEFEHIIWDTLRQIKYGSTKSYKEIAKIAGHHNAFRAVGSANRKNIIPLIIPCHRVINNNGNLGGYSAGLELKKILLDIESKSIT